MSREGSPQLDLRLLGPLEVSRRGQGVPVGGPKPRALLAALALEPGRVVSVDRLVENLWPGEPPDTAPHAVQVYISQLRKALGTETIVTRAPGYVLEVDSTSVDVHRFTRLAGEGRESLIAGDAAGAATLFRSALALWRGPALADFTYEPFAQGEIARLEELRVVALEERIDADLALGREVELVSELEALVDSQPLRERTRAQLMLALYRAGRQADALAAYRSARDTLVEELGVEPGPRLKELEAAILRQDESLLPDVEAPMPAMQFRRLVAILFCDVVESMALADTLDAEALGQVLRRYFETVSAALTRHGGTVEKFAGDAVMAAFGIPVSHEDDALRAARAGFEIQAGVAALGERLAAEHGIGLEVRVGIAAGEVVATPTETRQRFVAGDAVGVAARLQQAAAPGEIVVGEVVARLIDHAARLEPLGELDVETRKAPIRMFRLAELTPLTTAFESRTDAPLVGRKRELAALRKVLKRAVDDQAVVGTVVVGPPGVGKSRLAAEFTRRAKGVTTLWGRCLSYGDGITYWPLREALEQAAESTERDAVLAALDAETPPPAPELAWLFRRFCEASARERSLVLVFDDVHWAEPTFLELVEHLTDKGTGPIAVVCLAREELLEDRPAFLEGRANADRVLLDTLSAEETDALLEGLGGGTLESDQRARIVETAEGNPLFLEQLLALGLEGGLAERPLPETIQALLAARLDRLGPGERAVLERGAVVGKEFTADDVIALLDPSAAPTADAHLQTLAGRGFVRPRGDGAFGFRHVLLQESVYRATPKRLRAELHELYADRIDTTLPDIAELDEFVGYHLERSYQLRSELGESGRRTARLAEDGGRRLGAAGVRALKRGDMPATVNLLDRATNLLPTTEAMRLELMCELAIAQRASGDPDAAGKIFSTVVANAKKAGERRLELRARIETAYVRLLTKPEGAATDLLDIARGAIPTFETLGDDRALSRAWLLIGYVHGGIHGRHSAWEEAERRALVHYRRTGFPTTACLAQIAAAVYWGPTPVPEAIRRCRDLLADEAKGRAGRASVVVFLGGLEAQRGRFEPARALVTEAQEIYEDLGWTEAVAIQCGTVSADIELLAGDFPAAERTLREQCQFFESMGDRSHLAARAAKLADAIYSQGRLDEAERWTEVARVNAASDDLAVKLLWQPVASRILARNGQTSKGLELGRETVRRADETDGLNQRAMTRLALAEVLAVAEQTNEAEEAIEEAVRLFRRRGNVVAAVSATARLGIGAPA